MNLFHPIRVINWNPGLLGPWIVVAEDGRILWAGPSMETAERAAMRCMTTFIHSLPTAEFLALGVSQ